MDFIRKLGDRYCSWHLSLFWFWEHLMLILIAQGEREPSQISAESPALRVTLVTISFSGIGSSFSKVLT